MEMIKAFVGHSFTDEDKNIVREILDIFDSIQELVSFSWDHAEKAEPNILSDKVLQKMREANTFIGICTKKERVIKNKQLKKFIFNKSKSILSEEDLEWKTSDWIIQEIGCAFGRGMKIILLIEKGLRKPGGLQGDLEHIEFEREQPEKTYKKVLEMIKKLMPETKQEITLINEQKDKQIVGKEDYVEEKSEKHYEIEIKESWGKEDFLKGLINSKFVKKDEKEKEITDKFNIKYGKDNKEEVDVFEAKSLYYDFLINDEENLEEIIIILKQYPNNSELNKIVASIYDKCEQYDFAQKYYYIAYQNCSNLSKKIDYISSAIISSIKSNNLNYKGYIDEMIGLDKGGENRNVIHKTLSKIAKLNKNDFLYFLILESAVNDFPLDTNFRFDLAFRYSEKKQNDFSFYHYSFLTKNFGKLSGNWNNLGVSAAALNLKNKAIEAYRKSEKLGETLAMSNIAKRFIEEGFFTEATTICNKALEEEDYHKNIINDLARIENDRTYEDDKVNKIIEEVNSRRKNILKISKGLLFKRVIIKGNYYKHPDCELNVLQTNDKIRFHGTYKKEDVLSSLLLKANNPIIDKRVMEEYSVEIEGTIFAHLIEASFFNNRTSMNEEDKAKNTKPIIMVVSEDQKWIDVYDKSKYEKLFELRSNETEH